MAATISAETWDMLVAEAVNFDRRFVPAPLPRDEVLICIHGWLATVEQVDVDGKARYTHSAYDNALALPFAFRLATAAVTALPACATIDPKTTRNDVDRLLDCGMLAGDRAAAAQALNVWNLSELKDPDGPEFAPALRRSFASAWRSPGRANRRPRG